MDWITRNEDVVWTFLPLALGGVGLLGRLKVLPGAARLLSLVALLGAGVILAAAVAGEEPAVARAWALAPVAALLALGGIASMRASRAGTGETEDLLIPCALALLSVTAISIVGMLVALAGLLVWAGSSGLRMERRSVGLARIVALAAPLLSLGLGLHGARLRSAGGASGLIEWLGLPLRGDAGTTAIFLALVVPLLLPGRLGGPTAGLCARGRGSRSSTAVVLIHVTLVWALQVLFGGAEALRTVGLVGLGLALLSSAGPRRSARERHAGLFQGAVSLVIFGAGTGDEGAACGVALALVAHAVAATVISLAVSRARMLAGSGGVRAMPQTTIFAWVAGLSLVGFPFTLGGLGASIGLGSAVRDGAEAWSSAVLIGIALLTGLVLVPLLMDPSGSDKKAESSAEHGVPGVAVPASAGLGAAFLIATGIVPGALQFLLPHPGASLAAYPDPLILAGSIAVGGVLGVVLRRVLASR